ncbi:MAG: peptide chain release factor 1 [Gemmatimonadetes bacterium]|nr:peptide chain release factor 1 [Gemmatimonadota bacterium]
MIEKLGAFEARYEELGERLGDPETVKDLDLFRSLSKEFARVREIVEESRLYAKLRRDLEEANSLLAEENDPEILELARAERDEVQPAIEAAEARLQLLLLPPDPNDDKNTIVEIRAGTGGEEASLFAADLYRMYTRYAEGRGWKIELLGSTPTDKGGFREVVIGVEGGEVFRRLKFESGTHRVQRVPVTEASGRIHTSAATVAVLPEAESVEIDIAANDLRIDVYRSSGPGGQSVNTTDSAVRITHLPTGLVVTCQDEKSQHKNRDKAMKVLRARLKSKLEQEQQQEIAAARKEMVGSGDRSQRIRTYNFPQGRVTDHRIGLTLYKLPEVMAGDIDVLIEPLTEADRVARLDALSAE